jgi:pimeloyl-ACP methyl ester carboxylesterase
LNEHRRPQRVAGERAEKEHAMTDQPLQRCSVDDGNLEYETRGAGEPVLLIHGAFVADALAPLLAEPALTDRYRVISYHRRGFAGSSRPQGVVNIAQQAADARALMTHLGVDRAHVVGHSYGGCVALQLALDAPERVQSLALLEPALLAVPAVEQWFAEVGAPSIGRYEAGDAPGAVAHFLRGVFGPAAYADLERIAPDAIAQAVADADTFYQCDLPGMQAWQFGPDEGRRVAQPALGVLGADSDAVTPLFSQANALLGALVPQTEPFVLSAATHGMPFMNPRGLAEGLAAFFARHPAEPSA